MERAKKLIKLSSILYLLYAMLMITIYAPFGGFVLTIGAFLLSYSFLPIEDLNKKKVIITLIAIISIFINIISAIMLFIALESISSFKADNKNAPPEDEISSETKRIDILLKIGLAMILISGILFATSSWETIPDIIKVLGILLIGGIFLGLSKFSEEKLNIEKTTKAYYILGMAFILFTWISIGVFGIFTDWFSYFGAGKNLVYLLTFILLAGLLYLINKKYPSKEYEYFGIISCYLSIYHLLTFIGLNLLMTTLIISIITLVINIFIENKKYPSLSEVSILISYLFTPIIITQAISEPNILVTIAAALNMVNLIYLAIEEKDPIYNTLTVINSFSLIFTSILNLQIGSPAIIIFVTTSVFYLLINHNKYNRSKFVLYTNQVLYNLIATFTIIVMESQLQQVIFSVIYGIINFVNCYMTNEKDSKVDFYYQPVIIFIILVNFLNELDTYLFEIKACYYYTLTALTYAFIHKFDKHEVANKIYYLFTILGTICASMVIILVPSTICSVVTILIALYLYKLVDDKPSKKKTAFYILLLFTILVLADGLATLYFPSTIAYLMLLVVYAALTYLKKDPDLKKINYISIAVPLYAIVDSLSMHEELKLIFYNIFSLYILFLIITFFVKHDDTKDLVATIGTSLIVLSIIFNQALLTGIYVGLLGIGIIYLTYNKEAYKKLFYCGVVITIVNILVQLGDFWSQIPLPIYFLLLGASIVGFVTYKEVHKKEEPKKEIEKLIVDRSPKENIEIAEFCPYCGTKNPGGNFCLNCGEHLVIEKKNKK